MHGPATAGWLLVALCATAGGYCLLRLGRPGPGGGTARSRDGDRHGAVGGEALMAFGMAAMAVPASVVTPPSWVWPVYGAVFGGAAVRVLVAARGPVRRVRAAHRSHHLVGLLTMVYMAGAMAAAAWPAPGGPHAGHGAAGVPVVTGALLVYYAGYVLGAGARLLPPPVPEGPVAAGAISGAGQRSWGPAGWADRTELVPACRLAMGLGMLAMLLTL
ncbi:DUF5134 domain-containing protein [Streptomyces sp. NPDC093085]|uniref:DUF5134 domain-containing protein n=1 Tax=Streptomyces sp. NPDC093085 TaxID=3155068 RepID=UPI00343FAE11